MATTKVHLSKEETKNLLSMIKSSDESNRILAFEVLENADLKNYLGELFVLFKFGKLGSKEWSEYAPKAWSIIEKHLEDGSKTILASGDCLRIMTNNNASKSSIELFLENFMDSMVFYLDQLGYPADKFDISITLKE